MDQLLRNEFALVLRDSLKGTPKRYLASVQQLSVSAHKRPRLAYPEPPSSPVSPPPLASAFAPRATQSETQPIVRNGLKHGPSRCLDADGLCASNTAEERRESRRQPFQDIGEGSTNVASKWLVAQCQGKTAVGESSGTLGDTKRMSGPTSSCHHVNASEHPLANNDANAVSAQGSLDVLATVSAEVRREPRLPELHGQSQEASSYSGTSLKDTAQISASVFVTSSSVSPINAAGHSVQGLKTSSTFPDSHCGPFIGTVTSGAKTKGGKSSRTRSFPCAQCNSTFSERFNLNKHVRAVHERRRPFQCSTCHARFQQKDHMQKHEICVHKKLRQYSCTTCGAAFGWRGVLKKHRKSVHNIVDN